MLGSLWARWPGVAMYDSVTQYGQALDGSYADWHPPIMARTWALVAPWWPGSAPLFLVQMLLWWGGLGLLAAAFARIGRGKAAAAILLVGACPLWLGWGTAILKDAQMAACLLMAAGLCAAPILEGTPDPTQPSRAERSEGRRPVPARRAVPAALLILYATLVRGNAVFATVPLSVALFGQGRAVWSKAAAIGLGVVAVIAISPVINHRLLGAEATHVERSLPLYDMAGIADRAPLATLPGLPPARWAETERRGCYTPFYWNPYGEEAQCGFVGEAIAFDDENGPRIMRRWAALVLSHPLAYAGHRLAHLNANLRFWVHAGEPDADPPFDPEPNDLDLGVPARRPGRWLSLAGDMIAATPLGWPVVWLAAAFGLLWAGWNLPGGAARLGRALALSAAMMGTSFAVVSIASDLRYHLWGMIAAALAGVILVQAGVLRSRRGPQAAALVAAVVLIAGVGRIAAAPVHVPVPPRVPSPSQAG